MTKHKNKQGLSRFHKEVLFIALVVIGCLIAMGITLAVAQSNLALSGYADEMTQQNEQIKEAIEETNSTEKANTADFDDVFQAKADTLAFMANNNTGFETTDTKMVEYKSLFDVDNVLVVAKDGTIKAQAQSTKADFKRARFNKLKSVFSSSNDVSTAMVVSLPDQEWYERYYSSKINDDTMVVLEVNPKRLDEILDNTTSFKAMLGEVSIGQNGYVMAVSGRDYTVEYHPDETLIGTDAVVDGLKVSDLQDGKFFHMTFAGQKLYCGVFKSSSTYYISCLPQKVLTSSRNTTVAVILFAVGLVMLAVAFYSIMVVRDDRRRGHADEDYTPMGPVRFSKKIGGKAAMLSVAGLVLVIVVSFYMQTLFALSSESIINEDRATAISQEIENSSKREASLREEGNTRYLNKAKIAAYIVSQNDEMKDRSKLTQLSKELQTESINIFDINGTRTVSTMPTPSFELSTNPEDQSYEFRRLLTGATSVIQDAREDDETGVFAQYIGVPLYDKDNQVNGILQISVDPDQLEELVSATDISKVLESVQVGGDGFAFAVEKATGIISYYPDQLVQYKKATEVGLTESQLTGGYSDYVTINGTRYYVSSVETPEYYIYVTGGESELMRERLPLTIFTAIMAFIALLILFILLSFETNNARLDDEDEIDVKEEQANLASLVNVEADDPAGPPNFEIQRPGTNSFMRTQSAASRWLRQSLNWDEKTPEAKLGTVLRWVFNVFIVLVCIGTLFHKQIFGEQSVFNYILGGGWSHGLNIFAITAALMSACVIATVASCINEVLYLISGIVSARGETVLRLICSIIRYGTVIVILYYSLSLLGVDTATLLASAGLLTLAIGFGAQSLVSDILSGLFIIFEGEFRVGDVISVGDKGGTVIEIGVRTTKIDDGSGNVLVMRNSEISNVLNKTKMDSYASVDFDVVNGESLSYFENVLEEELPQIKKRLPAIISGPFYKGVVALQDSTTTVRIVATCSERNRAQLERDLKREVKLLMAHHDIAPYQQWISHEADHQETSEEIREQQTADIFTKQQEATASQWGNEEQVQE